MATDTLTRAKYGGYDFATLTDELKARLQVKFAANFNDYATSSMGMMLIDVFAYGLDNLAFYLDQRATDAYMTTARTRSAVSKHTRMLGYKIAPATASVVDLDVNLAQTYAFLVTIPAKFQFTTPSGVIFEAAKAVDFPANTPTTTVKTVPCYQGVTYSDSFVAAGSPGQTLSLRQLASDEFVVSGSASVIVNGSPFTESKRLQFDATDQFEVDYVGIPPSVLLGDGLAGNIPVAGSAISVSYIVSKGVKGRTTLNSITKEVITLVVNSTSIKLTINNPRSTVGGDDAETSASAKINAPQSFAARGVAVTQSDYESLASAFSDPIYGRVAIAQAVSVKDTAGDIYLQAILNSINSISSSAQSTISAAQAPVVSAIFSSRTLLTDTTSKIDTLDTGIAAISASTTSAATAMASAYKASDVYQSSLTTALSDINTSVIAARAYIAASAITAPDQAALVALLDQIVAYTARPATDMTSLKASISSASISVNAISPQLTSIGRKATVGTYIYTINANTNSTQTNMTTASTALSAIDIATASIYSSILGYTVDVSLHVDSIVAQDGMGNVIEVPILSRDIDGFYVAPSNALINSLQSYLDGIREVSQIVQVISGAPSLVLASLAVRLGVLSPYSLDSVSNAASAKIDTILRDRKFGESLYISDFDSVLSVPGVSFINIAISGAVDGGSGVANDSSGNLVITSGYVVTKGTVVITPEIRSV